MKNRIAALLVAMLLLAGGALQAALAEAFTEESFGTGAPLQEEAFFEEAFTDAFAGEDLFGGNPEDALSDGLEEAEEDGEAEEDVEEGEADYSQARSVLMLPTEQTTYPFEPWMGSPTNLIAVSNKNSTVQLKWTPCVKKLPKNVRYYVYDIHEETGAGLQIGKGTTGTKLTVKNVTGGDHVFMVRAEHIDPKTKKETYGMFSDKATVAVHSVLWQKKPKVRAEVCGTSIRVSWTVKEAADFYLIHVDNNGYERLTYSLGLEYVDQNPAEGKNTYNVLPFKGGETGKKASKSIKYKPVEPWAAVPVITDVTQTGDGRAAVRWKVIDPAEYYILTGGKKSVTVEASALTVIGDFEFEYEIETALSGSKTFRVTPAKKNEKGKLVRGSTSAGYRLKLVKQATALPVTNVVATAGVGGIRIEWENHNPNVDFFGVALYSGNGKQTMNIVNYEEGRTKYETVFSGLGKGVYGYYIDSMMKGAPKIRDVQPRIDTAEVKQEGVNVESIAFNQASIQVENGQKGYLSIVFTPSDATVQTARFLSMDPGIATVTPYTGMNGCVVNGNGVGKTTIVAISDDLGLMATCEVEVTRASVSYVTLNKYSTVVGVGETEQLIPTVFPEEAWNKDVTWSSGNEKIATVDSNGVVTGVRTGTVPITVTTFDQHQTATCNVTVTDVTGVSVSPSKLALAVGGMAKLYATVSPAGAVNKTLNWTSDNPGVATVDNKGFVTAIAKGTATITATSAVNGDCAGSCTVYVDTVAVELNHYEVKLKKGETVQMKATVTPDSYTVTWSSSNPAVATVSATGLVTAVGDEGVATISAHAGGALFGCHVVIDTVTYRALLVGNTYTETSYLVGPGFDIRNMETVLKNLPRTPYAVTKKQDLDFNNDGLVNAIADAFKDADDNDVSLFYFSGHGGKSGSIIGQDDRYVTPSALRTMLDKISGKKIVFADSCYSGKMIGRSAETQEDGMDDGEGSFEEAFIAAFSLEGRSSENLADNGYFVLTASQGTSMSKDHKEYSVGAYLRDDPYLTNHVGCYKYSDGEIVYVGSGGKIYGVTIIGGGGRFTSSLVRALGYNYSDDWSTISATSLLADANADLKVTFSELYNYVKSDMSENQVFHKPQVYPENSGEVFFMR